MPRSLSNTFKSAVFAQQTNEAFIMLVTISHPDFTDDILISNDPTQDLPVAGVRGTISRGLEFIYIPFSIVLPQDDDTGVNRATISVDNVNNDIIEHIRSADSALSIKFEVVLSSDPDSPEISFDEFKLEHVTYNASTIEGDISIEYFELEPFPSKDFTPSDFPGLF